MTTYHLVPVEATRKMTDAAEYLVRRHGELVRGQGIWEAMLQAAPVPKNELLEAAKETVSFLRNCNGGSRGERINMDRLANLLDLAIRNAEQAQGTPTP